MLADASARVSSGLQRGPRTSLSALSIDHRGAMRHASWSSSSVIAIPLASILASLSVRAFGNPDLTATAARRWHGVNFGAVTDQQGRQRQPPKVLRPLGSF